MKKTGHITIWIIFVLLIVSLVSCQDNTHLDQKQISINNKKISSNNFFYWKDRAIGKYTKKDLEPGKMVINDKDATLADIVGNSATCFIKGMEKANIPNPGSYVFKVNIFSEFETQAEINISKVYEEKYFTINVKSICNYCYSQKDSFVRDVDSNGIPDLGFYIQEPPYVTTDFVFFVELSNPPKAFVLDIAKRYFERTFSDKDTQLICIDAGRVAGLESTNYDRLHIGKLSNGEIIDVSYKYPEQLKEFWGNKYNIFIRNTNAYDLFNRLVFAEQIGKFYNELPIFLAKCDDSQTRYLVISLVKNGYVLQADTDEHFKKWYNREPPFEGKNHDLSKYSTYKEKYDVFSKLQKEKDFISSCDFKIALIYEYAGLFGDCEQETSNTNQNQVIRSWEIETKNPLGIENDSYWPERKICKHSLSKIKAFSTKPFHFPPIMSFEDKMLEICNWVMNNEETSFSKFKPEILQYYIIPISENIFFLHCRQPSFVIGIKIDKNDDIWLITQPYYGGEGIVFGGYGDVNSDGIKDYIFMSDEWGATHNANTHYIITYKDASLYDVVFSSYFQIEHFFGINNRIGLFGSEDIGCAPIYPGYYTCKASVKFAPLHYLEFRKDGYVYDVTYKHINSEMYELANKLLKGKPIEYSFFNLPLFDLMGLTRKAQKNLLDTIKPKDEFENNLKKIILDLQKENKPFLLQDCKEVPKNWQAHTPYS